MRINLISQTDTHLCNRNNINFRYNVGKAVDSNGALLYYKTTNFFRNDVNWAIISQKIHGLVEKFGRIDIFDLACSSGEETITLIIQLIKDWGKEFLKKVSIFASDIDKDNIDIAQKGVYNTLPYEELMLSELDKTQEATQNTGIPSKNPEQENNDYVIWHKSENKVTIRDDIRKHAHFYQKDLMEEAESLPLTPKVVLCKNVWPYLGHDKEEALMAKFAEKFIDDSSLLIVGGYDINNESIREAKGHDINYLLEKYHFISTGTPKIYKKDTEKFIKKISNKDKIIYT